MESGRGPAALGIRSRQRGRAGRPPRRIADRRPLLEPRTARLDTIEPLARRLRLEPIALDDLRERELAIPPGADFESAVKAAWLAPATASPGSESNQGAQSRGLGVVRTILQNERGRHTVVSTHGNLLALILNGLEPTYGFEFWRSLTFPDVYELMFQESALANVRRLWHLETPRV